MCDSAVPDRTLTEVTCSVGASQTEQDTPAHPKPMIVCVPGWKKAALTPSHRHPARVTVIPTGERDTEEKQVSDPGWTLRHGTPFLAPCISGEPQPVRHAVPAVWSSSPAAPLGGRESSGVRGVWCRKGDKLDPLSPTTVVTKAEAKPPGSVSIHAYRHKPGEQRRRIVWWIKLCTP